MGRKKLDDQREKLPIFSARQKLLDEIYANDCVVIIGETGSGKTTQIPQYLHESGITRRGMVAITQPRRVAAITVAQRVSEEMEVTLGQEVGYSIRFDDKTSNKTKIKFLTDGMLLRELSGDKNLSKYSVVILDEAHERTVHTDMLMALLKQIQQRRNKIISTEDEGANKRGEKGAKKSRGRRNPLRLVCMSATLAADRFASYFNAKILYVSGRLYPVAINFTQDPQPDYLDAVLISVLQIHLYQQKGDILVFLTGQEEIEMCRNLLEKKVPLLPQASDTLLVLPLYAALPADKQLKVFSPAPSGCRKVILSTNIAETSITINNIKFIVDTGVVKVRQYQPRTGMDSLVVVPVSKAESWQRSGRAGRVSDGVCYRLYTEPTFHTLNEDSVPEILRCNLCSVVLQLKALNVTDILGFDFMDKPPQTAIVRALEHLYALSALNDKGGLTTLGRQLSRFPLDPLPAKVLISSSTEEFACSEEMISLVSLLSVESGIFVTPADQKEKATAAKLMFCSPEGDHMTYLDVFNGFQTAKNPKKQWCLSHFINYRSLSKVLKIRAQLKATLERLHMPLVSCGDTTIPIRRCLVTGFFLNAARRQPDGSYRTLLDGQSVRIHPSSVLLGKKAECVLYNELVITTRHYMRDISVIDMQWLPELVPSFFSTNTGVEQKKKLSGRAVKRLSGSSANSMAMEGGVGGNEAPDKKKSKRSK